MSVYGRPPRRGRPMPAEPLGDEMLTDRPTRGPLWAKAGVEIPERGDGCDVKWFQVEHGACEPDDPDPTPLLPRHLRVPGF